MCAKCASDCLLYVIVFAGNEDNTTTRPSSPKSFNDLFDDGDGFPSSGFSLTGIVDAAVDAAVATEEKKRIIVHSPSSSPLPKRPCSEFLSSISSIEIKAEPNVEVTSTSETAECNVGNGSQTSYKETSNHLLVVNKRLDADRSNSIDDEGITGNSPKPRSFSRESTVSRENSPCSPSCGKNKNDLKPLKKIDGEFEMKPLLLCT